MGRPHSTRTRSPVRFASMATDSPRLAIVGSGFSGLCLGIRLKQLGIDCFTIFEKADRLGGTWRDNTYPGAACDVPAFSYCFSFEQKTDWSRKWAPQEEIRDYMDHCARKYDVLRHIRFGSEVAGARWDDDAAAWRSRMLAKVVGRLAERNIQDTIADPRLREVLLPDYPIGGKRILISDDYYQALGRANVEVVTDGIDHVREDAVVGRDGRVHAVDAIILATGFESTAFLAPMAIEGAGGRRLDAAWADGARAYRGITVAGFPNFFMMYGPNTNLGHNSIIFMLECQTRYIVEAIETLRRRGLTYLDVRPEAMAAYNARIERELARTVWAATEKSWYKIASGRITNNWSGTTTRYWWTTRRFDHAQYRLVARAALAERSRSAA